MFEEYVDKLGKKKASKQVAVEMSDTTLSFSALAALSNRIAHHLLAKGVGPGDKVAILFDRVPQAYASVLAVSQVGAAFVPLDRSFPADRVAFILEDSSVKTVLSLTIFSTVFDERAVDFIALDASEDEIAKLPATRPSVELSDDDGLAYIIYTSGTTGQPKGVQINHSSICNFIRVARDCYKYTEEDRVYQSLTLAFDYCVEEIWVPLTSGSRLVPAPAGVNLVGRELYEFLRDKKITAYCSVPTVLATIEEDLPDLRLLFVSGEACPPDLARKWTNENRRILNVYGPTEATVSATWGEIDPSKNITIGAPLPTYSVAILDPDSTVVLPRGEVGEIAIAGIGVGIGYLNRNTETQRAFISDTIGMPQNPGGRIYRSGDLGRITDDDEIEYLGRADTQVKIRGFRIELAEIEEVARRVSGINAVVVNPWEGDNGTELVAYFAPEEGSEVDISKLHSEMSQQLPPYMVPDKIEKLTALPLQASGKIDRRALPEPTADRLTDTGKAFVIPKDGLEADLAEVLASVLKVERISADADFFADLGADSLIMARYLGSVRKKLKQKKASMMLVYENPSIIALAAALEPTAAEASESIPAPAEVAQVADAKVTLMPVARLADPAQEVGIAATDIAESLAPQENRVASRFEHIMCGIWQLFYMFGYVLMSGVFAVVMLKWIIASETWTQTYLRSVGTGVSMFLGLVAFSIAVKWLAVGRFTKTEIPLWSFEYVRFWMAKTAIRTSPMIAFVGTPFYNVYLRLLGARIGRGTLIYAPAPVCTDLISIGDNTLIRQDSIFNGYTVHRGWVRTGSVDIGSRVYIGEQTVLDINSRIEDDSQLGNSSCLQENQSVPCGQKWHGTPARPTSVNYDRVEPLKTFRWAGALYTGGFMLSGFLVSAPILFMLVTYLLELVLARPSGAKLTNYALVPLFVFALYVGGIVLATLRVMVVPRLYNLFFKPEKVHKLFGFQYYLAQGITTSSNSIFLHTLWGDSALIMPYFRALGYDLSTATQNGSNFGVEQVHHSPFLCKFNRNTLISDGLYMLNMDMTTTSFRMSKIEVPADAYLGNDLRYPVGARVGMDCMIATKAMLPIEGEVQEGVGILGSPPIQIPRSVARDGRFDHYKKPGIFEQRLAMKLRSNLITLGLYMLRSVTALMFIALMTLWMFEPFVVGNAHASPMLIGLLVAVVAMLSLFFVSLYNIAWERVVLLFYPVKPRVCSLYERPFWNHERFWKMNINLILESFNGTPIKAFMLRLQGAKVGRMVFDNGCGVTEPSTVEIGDYSCLNFGSSIQGHSLEDGTFKSDAISIGERCTIGINGFIHYGTVLGDDAVVDAHSFVMKGSIIGDNERWEGNPAQPAETDIESETPSQAA